MRTSVLGWFVACVVVGGAVACSRPAEPPLPPAAAPVSGTLETAGISSPVRVVRDRWGIPHITASTRDDLFFAQGFVQASDRLFQMDLWRRAAQGRLAEVLGANFIGRDAMTRRIQYRGDLDAEWASYGPDAREIASAFVRGVNAWIEIARQRPPEAFVLAGWLPERWHPEDLLNRTDAFLESGDGFDEIVRARLIAAVGGRRAAALLGDEAPADGPRGVDLAAITYQVGDTLRQIGTRPFFTMLGGGSNAWVISGRRSATGLPIVATDPHRLLANPSLRYLVHLKAPGWNVIGATAPWLPGVAIGHNERVAWGMTSFAADTMDLFVQRVNPDNRHQIEKNGRWENTTVIADGIWVKGSEKPVPFTREYTPDGIVIGVDTERHLVFTLRWSGLEPGGAGELASLALDRASSSSEVSAALSRWKMPAVEVIYGDQSGVIGSQVAGAVPVRRGGDGRLPGAGWMAESKWDGWRAPQELPRTTDPGDGYIVSANGNRARTERLRDALAAGTASDVAGSVRLQQDVVAWNAERLIPLLARLRPDRPDVGQARDRLVEWDRRVAAGSNDALTYIAWERAARRMLVEPHVPRELVDDLVRQTANRFVPALTAPSSTWFSGNLTNARDALMLHALNAVIDEFDTGASQDRNNPIVFAHPLAITETGKRRFNVGPFARSGYSDTVMSLSGRAPDAAVGASFSAVFDTADWDRSVALNAPGQSESPDSPHAADLARLWAEGRPFPLAFSDKAVAANAESTLTLAPRK